MEDFAMLSRVVFSAAIFFSFAQASCQEFEPTIPVLDLHDFLQEETKQTFIDNLSKAMHEVGFFALVHPHIPLKTLNDAYEASQTFFQEDLEKKSEIFKPSLDGQRGYIPGENAQGSKQKDLKEFLHIGRKENLWPSWMDLETPFENLMACLDENSNLLQKAFALAMGEPEDFLIEMTQQGECLLRALHYPPGPVPGTVWAGEHTDIDLFTILPMATEEGLQVFHEGRWIDVKVPADAFIINCGDMLQNMTNGFFKSSLHRVEARPNKERYSIVYFIHPRAEDPMGPRPSAIQTTGGIQRYPQATRIELLATRLREIGLAGPALLEREKNSGVMERIQELVESGAAAEPVRKTYSIWKESQAQNSNHLNGPSS